MKIYLRDTLTNSKVEFVPIDEKNVRMYVCGPTIYDYIHLGNARPQVIFDILYRLLKYVYGAEHVTYVKNITDVDDKIIARANQEKISITELVNKFERIYKEDISKMNILAPNVEPKATTHIQEMIEMIQTLIDKGFAYVSDDGNVLFQVDKYPVYGQLSNRKLEDLIAGSRVNVEDYKRSPADFVLWKPAKADEPFWPSPWGNGRPGWHIECSAMSKKYLGETFDIHGGGNDLTFPHHENEIAQSCCANDVEYMANYWVHNGMLKINGEKMSKSLGNFFTLHEILEKYHGEVVKFYLLGTHYHQPMNWTDDGLSIANKTLNKWYFILLITWDYIEANPNIKPNEKFIEALCDDLNTPKAISILHELANQFEKSPTIETKSEFLASAKILGILQDDPNEWAGIKITNEMDQILKLIKQLRIEKNWEVADKLKTEFEEKFSIKISYGPNNELVLKKILNSLKKPKSS